MELGEVAKAVYQGRGDPLREMVQVGALALAAVQDKMREGDDE